MSEAALRAAQRGLDAASALKVGQVSVDAAAFAVRQSGQATVGVRAEVVKRITDIISVGAGGFAEKDIGGQSRIGGSIFGRLKWD